MNIFEKQMKKVYRKNTFNGSYTISLGKADEIDEAKFKENISEDDEDKCEVIVLFKNDFDEMINAKKSLEIEIEDLKSTNIEKKNQIDELTAKIDEMSQSYIDKVTQSSKELNKEFSEKLSAMSSERQNEIDILKDKISEMQISHLEDISELKQSHSEEMDNIKNTLLKLRTEDKTHIDEYIEKSNRIKEDLKSLSFFENHTKSYSNLIDEFDDCMNEVKAMTKNKIISTSEDFKKLE